MLFGGLALGYLLFVNSCMTMRSSKKETAAYFTEQQLPFCDSIYQDAAYTLRFVKTGKEDAPTLLFIHGSPGGWDAWEAYLSDSLLRQKYRLIAPDRPGFGYSNFRKSASLQEQAEILNSFMKSMQNGQPTALIGHSYGGPLIVQMAVDAPEMYQQLYILAGALDPEAEKPEKWRKPLTWIPLKYLVPGALKPSNDELWMLKQDLIDLKPRLSELTQATVIIHGTADQLVPYSNVPYMKEEFSQVATLEIITLEEENHFIVWDREALIKQHLGSWKPTKP